MSAYLGIDPGLSGAIAIFNSRANPGHEIEVFDMPVHRVKVNGSKKTVLDLQGLCNIIDPRSQRISMAFVEEVGAMPGQGVTSMFNFGFMAGCCQMVIAAHRIPLHTVRPSVWKKAMKVTTEKDTARRAAAMRFPKQSELFSRVKDDGRAEAALLAVYGAGRADIFESADSIEELM